jgi:hypothetical protein
MKRLALIVVALSLVGCRYHDGRDGRNGDRGATGPQGTTPFSYSGQFTYPTMAASAQVPGFNFNNGDVVNVYIQWDTPQTGPQGYIQIGNQGGIGQSAFYSVQGNAVTITTVIGPQTTVDWFITGITKG